MSRLKNLERSDFAGLLTELREASGLSQREGCQATGECSIILCDIGKRYNVALNLHDPICSSPSPQELSALSVEELLGQPKPRNGKHWRKRPYWKDVVERITRIASQLPTSQRQKIVAIRRNDPSRTGEDAKSVNSSNDWNFFLMFFQ